jgi:6-pyruvoyltetrahydropterin/6-carboxytetrahydropterin synthase
MNVVRISKTFTFEAAHFLPKYDGLCKNIHGHSYQLTVTLKGTPEQDKSSCKVGMLMDFSILGDLVKNKLLIHFDHALIIEEGIDFSFSTKLLRVNYTPTCENLIVDIGSRLRNILPSNISLFSLLLYETKNNFCEWYADDN